MLRIDGQLKFSEYQNIYDVVVPQNHILRKIADEIDSSLLAKFRKTRITEDMLEDMLTETIRQAIDKVMETQGMMNSFIIRMPAQCNVLRVIWL